MAKKRTEEQGKAYELKITLLGTDPPVWRRVQVPADILLSDLHRVIQAVMGWEHQHLHEFEIKGVRYTDLDQAGGELEAEDEAEVPLNELVTRVRTKFRYWYDFGDDWRHEIQLERILPPTPEGRSVRCVDGANACPPEDCGGTWGYYAKLKVLKDPQHEDYEWVAEWMGEDFDPTAFDLEDVNRAFRKP